MFAYVFAWEAVPQTLLSSTPVVVGKDFQDFQNKYRFSLSLKFGSKTLRIWSKATLLFLFISFNIFM